MEEQQDKTKTLSLYELSNATDMEVVLKQNILALKEDDNAVLEQFVTLKRVHEAIGKSLKAKAVKDTLDTAYEGLNTDSQGAIIKGAKIQRLATYTKYEFGDCGHPLLDFLLSIENRAKDIRKSIENELKAIPEPTVVMKDGKPITQGGKKKIIIDHVGIRNIVRPIIEDGNTLLDTFDEENNIIEVYKPIKMQTMGLKVSKK